MGKNNREIEIKLAVDMTYEEASEFVGQVFGDILPRMVDYETPADFLPHPGVKREYI